MKVRIDITLDGHDEPDESVELPIPEVPDMDGEFGVGHWRWVGDLPRTKVDITDKHAIAIYVIKRDSSQARVLNISYPTARRRGVNKTPKSPPQEEPAVPRSGPVRKLSPELVAEAVRLYTVERRSVRQIWGTFQVEDVKVSLPTIYRALERAGVEMRGREDVASESQKRPEVNDKRRTTLAERAAFKCPDCSRTFTKRPKLESHRKSAHPEPDEETAPAPESAPARVAPTTPADHGKLVTLSDSSAVLDAIGHHFRGALMRPLADRLGTTQAVLINTVQRAYDLMDVPFSPVGPPHPSAKAQWEDEMGDLGRKNLAKRIAEGR